jgi:DNA polymerase III delta prime subunit
MRLDQNAINQQLELLATYRRTLRHLLQQAAQFGGEVFAPPHTVNGIAEARAAVARIKGELRAAGVTVEDASEDEEQQQQQSFTGYHQAPITPLDRQRQRNRRTMLQKVKTIWIDGLLDQSLAKELRIALDLTERPDAVELPLNALAQELHRAPRPLPAGTPIVKVFDQMGGTLLILGAPGAGKTTLLLELARDLIERAEQDEDHPIPVVFNLSSWAVKQRPLKDWLAEELNTKYDVPRKLAQAWVDADVLLPLLDGLDEVVGNQRNACAASINAYRQEHGLLSLAVCSRLGDYEVLTTKLRLQGALLVQALSLAQVDAYLERAGETMIGVRAAVLQDVSLGELLTTPLMLSTIALAYSEDAVADIQAVGTVDERRRQLFDAYIGAMFKRRSKGTHYAQQQVVTSLGWLAGELVQHNQTVFSIERIQSTWLLRQHRAYYDTFVRLVFGLLGGLVGALAFGLAFGRAGGLIGGLLGGLISGLGLGPGAGLSGGLRGLVVDRFENILIIERLHWSWSREVLIIGFVGGMVGGLGFGLISGLTGGLVGGLAGALVGGLGIGLGGNEVDSRTTPNQGVHRSARSMFVIGPGLGIILGMALGMVGGFSLGLGFGIAGGMGFGMDYGGRTVFQHYTLRFLLARKGYVPFRLVPFLDYCVDRIFLRRVGGGYIFVHRLLMEHFASLYTQRSETTQPATRQSDGAAN